MVKTRRLKRKQLVTVRDAGGDLVREIRYVEAQQIVDAGAGFWLPGGSLVAFPGVEPIVRARQEAAVNERIRRDPAGIRPRAEDNYTWGVARDCDGRPTGFQHRQRVCENWLHLKRQETCKICE